MANKTTVKPLDDRIILKPTVAETKTASGIFLPESATEKPMTGTVIAVGPGKLNEDGSRTELTINVGDVVLYGKYAGTEVKLEDNDYIIVKQSDILAIVE